MSVDVHVGLHVREARPVRVASHKGPDEDASAAARHGQSVVSPLAGDAWQMRQIQDLARQIYVTHNIGNLSLLSMSLG